MNSRLVQKKHRRIRDVKGTGQSRPVYYFNLRPCPVRFRVSSYDFEFRFGKNQTKNYWWIVIFNKRKNRGIPFFACPKNPSPVPSRKIPSLLHPAPDDVWLAMFPIIYWILIVIKCVNNCPMIIRYKLYQLATHHSQRFCSKDPWCRLQWVQTTLGRF